jgi:hypothetical protein
MDIDDQQQAAVMQNKPTAENQRANDLEVVFQY